MDNKPQPESQTRSLRFAPFAFALICFALPFVEVSCQGQRTPFTGVELVIGKTIEQKDPFTGQANVKKTAGDGIFMGALVCILAATFLCLVPGSSGKLLPAIAGAVGGVLLVIGKTNFEKSLAEQSQGAANAAWGIGFGLACVLVAAGTLVSGYQFFQASAKKPPGLG